MPKTDQKRRDISAGTELIEVPEVEVELELNPVEEAAKMDCFLGGFVEF